jgi:hypothetical protein
MSPPAPWVCAARDNPFASHRQESLPYRIDSAAWPGDPPPADVDLDTGIAHLLQQLDALGGRGAIVAPKGHGKTTLLDAITQSLQRRGRAPLRLRFFDAYRRLAADDWAVIDNARADDLLIIDGAEQLGRLAWWRIRRRLHRRTRLIITTHAPGLLPTLLVCGTSAELLRNLIGELLPDHDVPLSLAESLHARHGGNLRLALREMYDRWATDGPAALEA